MGACITKPPHIRRPSISHTFSSNPVPAVSVPSAQVEAASDQSQDIILAVSEEGEIAPFRVSISEGEMEYSQSDMGENLEDSEMDYSLGSAMRDSMEILRERRRYKDQITATLEEEQSQICRLQQEIAQLKHAPARTLTCFLCKACRPKVLFRPCRHLICCSNCSPQASICPACQQTISTREEVFL